MRKPQTTPPILLSKLKGTIYDEVISYLRALAQPQSCRITSHNGAALHQYADTVRDDLEHALITSNVKEIGLYDAVYGMSIAGELSAVARADAAVACIS